MVHFFITKAVVRTGQNIYATKQTTLTEMPYFLSSAQMKDIIKCFKKFKSSSALFIHGNAHA